MTIPNNCIGIISLSFIRYNEDEKLPPGDYLIIEKMKYNHEKDFEYLTNIISVDCDGSFFTLNDNREGQQYYKIIAYASLSIDINYFLGKTYIIGGNTNV